MATFVSDDLTPDEWNRRRNLQASGADLNGAIDRGAPIYLHDGLPPDVWQRVRARQAGGPTPAPMAESRDGAAAATRRVALSAPPPSARGPAPAIDPSRTDVFPRGSDGKLHPLPGWKTTGPFDAGAWSREINWPGVGHDLLKIGLGIPGWFLPPLLGAAEIAALVGNVGNAGVDTLDDLNKVDSRRR